MQSNAWVMMTQEFAREGVDFAEERWLPAKWVPGNGGSLYAATN
jgi:hypothetical protein